MSLALEELHSAEESRDECVCRGLAVHSSQDPTGVLVQVLEETTAVPRSCQVCCSAVFHFSSYILCYLALSHCTNLDVTVLDSGLSFELSQSILVQTLPCNSILALHTA